MLYPLPSAGSNMQQILRYDISHQEEKKSIHECIPKLSNARQLHKRWIKDLWLQNESQIYRKSRFRLTYLNMLVSMVYDSPDNGWCMKPLCIGPWNRLIFHATQTAAFIMQIFQHNRLPSDASAYGCITDTNATPAHGRIRFGISEVAPAIAAYQSLSF